MSPAILYRQLPGEGLDAFIAEFRKAAARDPFGTVFIVPTSHLARDIVRRLRGEGAPVVADTVTTLSGFARKVFLDYATSETLISRAESRLILARLLDTGRYPLLSGTGAVDELATLFEAILMRKVNYPAALDDLATARGVEITRLFDAYRRFIDEHDLVDESTLFARAVRMLSDTGLFRTVYIYGLFEPMPRVAGSHYHRPPRTVFVYGLFEPMPLERDLLCTLRESAEEFHYSIPHARDPVVFIDDGEWLLPGTVISGDAPDTRRSRLATLFSRSEPAGCGGCVHLAERRDRLDEVQAIAKEIRDLLAAGARPGEIAVAFPDVASALPYVEEVFPEFDVPYSASEGQSLSSSPFVRTLFADLSKLDGPKTIVEHIAACRLLLERWQAPAMQEEGDPALHEERARVLGEFFDLLASFERLARVLPGEKMPVKEFSSLLAQLAAGTRTGSRQNGDGVRVLGVREVAHLSVSYFFIGNLVEGTMPRTTTSSLVATDAGTRSPGMQSREDILREERYYFTAALLSARSRVYLSYPAADGATSTVRSGFVDAVCEAFSPETWGSGDNPDSALVTARRTGTSIARGEPAIDPTANPGDVQATALFSPPLPDDLPAAPVQPGIPSNGERGRVYSVSEIETYLRGPAESRLRGLTAKDVMTRGLAVHEVFRGRDPAAVLRRHGLDPTRAPEYRELYTRFLSSPLMRGIVRDHREVPFLVRVNGIAFKGVIDRLVQRLNGTWILIVYKTGTPGDAGNYAVQMTIYRHAAAQVLGSPVKPYLYFIDADRWAEIEMDEERVFAEIGGAVTGIEEGSR